MRNRYLRIVVIGVLLIVTGCVTTGNKTADEWLKKGGKAIKVIGGKSPGSSPPPQVTDGSDPCLDPTVQSANSARLKTEGALIVAGIGSVSGALIALMSDKDTEAILKYTAIGGTLGALAGYGWGMTVAARKEQYAKEECRLFGETRVVKNYNTELNEYNRKIESDITKIDSEIVSLKERYKTGEANASELKAKQNQIKTMLAKTVTTNSQMTNELTSLEAYLISLKKANVNTANTTVNEEKISDLEKEISALRENIKLLDKKTIQVAKMVVALNE